MNEFPLTPFFDILETSGIRVTLDDYDRIYRALHAGGPWNIARLRGTLLALLVHRSDHEPTFLRHFDSFFNPTLETQTFTADQLDLIWKELQILMKGDEETPPHLLPPMRAIGNEESVPVASPQRHHFPVHWLVDLRKSFYASALAVALLAMIPLAYLYWSRKAFLSDQITALNLQFPSPTPNTPSPTPTGTETASPTPIQTPTPPGPTRYGWKYWAAFGWRYWTAIVVGFLPLVLSYGFFLWRVGECSAEESPHWDPDGPSHLPLNEIGGKPAPYLDSATLDELADSLNYFQSRELGKQLHLPSSVEAVVRNSGLPQLVFRTRKELRTVYVLEDAFAEPLAWNPISQELAEGLGLRGISVRYGRFDGSPSSFRMDDGPIIALDDLDDNRSDYLVLLFSDGKGLRHHDGLILEMLAHWPFVAWMELREPRFWDESTAFIANKKVPIYPASRDGLLQAMRSFLTEQGSQRQRLDSSKWRGVPANVGHNHAIYVEYLLGDALPWAQACALMQPITPGLADALRRTFQPLLPPQRIERLFYLPGTVVSVSGLRFSLPVRAILRSGFARRWNQQQQQRILNFLLEQVAKIEPVQKHSLSHLSWRFVMACVLLESDPGAALKQIAVLGRTPLKNTIRSELQTLAQPGEALSDPGSLHSTKITLRRQPQERNALEYLAVISSNGDLDEHPPSAKLPGRLSDAWLDLVTPWWREHKTQAQIRPAISLVIAWVLISILWTPSWALVMVYTLLTVLLAFSWIDHLSAAPNDRPEKGQSRGALPAVSWTSKTQTAFGQIQPALVTIVLVIAALAFTMALGSWLDRSSNSNISEGKETRLAFISNNASDFWTIARAGTEKADAELPEVTVEFRIDSDGTAAEQQRIIDDLLANGINGIAISPVDPINQTQLINATAKKVLVITQDSDAPASDRVCHVGPDNVALGRQAGELIKEALPQGGQIMVFVGVLDAANAQQRYQGLREAIAGSNIQILDVRTDNTDRVRARANAADTLVMYPNVACLVGLWSYNGPAILNAVKDAGKVGQVKIVAFDEDDETLAGIKDGAIYATVVQQPFELGYQSVMVMGQILRGDRSGIPANEQVFVPGLSIKKDTVEAFQTKLNQLRRRS